MADNQSVKECIVKFDKTICEKAQKSELLTLRDALEKQFVSIE